MENKFKLYKNLTLNGILQFENLGELLFNE